MSRRLPAVHAIPRVGKQLLSDVQELALLSHFPTLRDRRFSPQEALMLDHPEKTARLIAALKAAAPFEVGLAPSLIEYLQAENIPAADRKHHVAWDFSYAGDEGGIICHLARSEETGRALVVSLTHVRLPRSMPFAAAVLDYQKHRVKKLKKQGQR